MNYADLLNLFYAGETEECIIQGEQYLRQNPTDTEVLNLLAVAYHDIVYNDGHEAVYDAIENYTIPYLKKALEIDPQNADFLFRILNYPLTNQFDLWNIGHPKLHITTENRDEFLEYSNRLGQIKGYEVYAYDFNLKIYEGLKDIENQLKTIDDSIQFFQDNFKDEREVRDHNISINFMKKIYLLDQDSSYDNQKLISYIQSHLSKFSSQRETYYFDLAEIAFEQNDYDLVLQILLKFVDTHENVNELITSEFVKWHIRISDLVKNGYHHADAFYFLLIIERNYYENLDLEESAYYHHALTVIQNYPTIVAGYHFAGAYLFEHEKYEEAIHFLAKALDVKPNATSLRRYIEAYVHLRQKVPKISWFEDHPINWYNEGASLSNFIDEIEDKTLSEALSKIQQQFYLQSDKYFTEYFKNDKFDTLFYCPSHLWAMNCNNLAILYNRFGEHNDAEIFAEKGLNLSEFWELRSTILTSLLEKNDYEKANKILTDYFEKYSEEDVPELNHLIFIAYKIQVDYNLNPTDDLFDEAQITLQQIYDYSEVNNELDEYDRRDLEASKNTIENTFFFFLTNESDQRKVEIYQKLADRYPNEANPQYMLMQFQNDLENYKASNAAAYNYLQNKPDFLLQDYDKARTIHFILKTHLLNDEYEIASDLFDENNQFIRSILDDEDYLTWLKYAIKAKLNSNKTNEFIQLTNQYKSIYIQNNWSFDDDLESVYLDEAKYYYDCDDLKKAHQLLDEVLKQNTQSELAKEYKLKWKKPGLFSKFGF